MVKKNIKTRAKKIKARKLFELKKLKEARALYQAIYNIDKIDSDALYMLGVVNAMLGELSSAITCLQQAVTLNPSHFSSQYNLGIALRDNGELEKAVTVLSCAIKIQPNNVLSYKPLAVALIHLKKFDLAKDVFHTLLQLTPKDAEAWCNQGFLFQVMGKLVDAIDSCKKALEIKPNYVPAYANMANALCSCGQYDEAMVCYKRCLELDVGNARSHSNLLLTLNYMTHNDLTDIYEEHRYWYRLHGANIVPLEHRVQVFNKPRILKLAYISPDFRSHSVSSFIEPVIANHNKNKIEVWCYSTVIIGDETTDRIKRAACQWRDVSRMSVSQIASQIASDEIDILVDLAGHTSSEIMQIMSHKPAPVQVTWLGYPNTTGIDTVDYRITDFITDLLDQDQFYTEKLIRLEGCFVCYQPPLVNVKVNKLPALTNGYITFGSFNNLSKIGDEVIDLWAKLLNLLTNSRIFIKNPSLTDEKTRNRYMKKFIDKGVCSDRVTLVGHTHDRGEHFKIYNKLDIALDTFPYNGATTTCEALWMGVPVVSLVGKHHASRVSASLLNAAGFKCLVCNTETEYLEVARSLANDINKLSGLRESLRKTLGASSLCDAKGYTKKLEENLQRMWQLKYKIIQ